MDKEKITWDTDREINFMPDQSDKKFIKNDYIYGAFPPERIAEIDEDLLWNV
jgi:hypothetical protein